LNPIATTFIAKAFDVAKPKLEENMFGEGAQLRNPFKH
jgi:hypothetical protein